MNANIKSILSLAEPGNTKTGISKNEVKFCEITFMRILVYWSKCAEIETEDLPASFPDQ